MDNSLASLGIEFPTDFINQSWAAMVEEENNRLSQERKSPTRVIKSPKKKLVKEISANFAKQSSPEIKEINYETQEQKFPYLVNKSSKKKLAWGSPTKNSSIKEDPDLPPLGSELLTKKSRKATTPKKVISQPK